ncbi:hypothetical protein HW423_05940 [Aerococcaceae bacterium INB8]|uniref:Uncharacterized protein n=1 Tax=Ruoffia halotolerans TaxID=2748684 RepID=A0A839A675_9LACT|nr:hypothetical protein [Ruoffia halotolerans]MBA5729320.1 hypothetical protein [Ruoffia halotolerans]
MNCNKHKQNFFLGLVVLWLLVFISSQTTQVQVAAIDNSSNQGSYLEDGRDDYEQPIAGGEEGELPPPPDPPENIESEPEESSSDESETPPESSYPGSSQESGEEVESSSQSSEGDNSSSSRPESSTIETSGDMDSSESVDETHGGDEPTQGNETNTSPFRIVMTSNSNSSNTSFRQFANIMMEFGRRQRYSLPMISKALISADFVPVYWSSSFMPLSYIYEVIFFGLQI